MPSSARPRLASAGHIPVLMLGVLLGHAKQRADQLQEDLVRERQHPHAMFTELKDIADILNRLYCQRVAD